MKHTFIVVALLALLVPGVLLAQEELTLEEIGKQLTALADRVEAIENLFAAPWSPEIVYTDDGICQSPLHTKGRYSRSVDGKIRQETADAYRVQHGVSIDPSDVYLAGIYFATHTNHVYLEYTINEKRVVEKWAHCQFLDHSEWEDVE